MNRQFFLDCSFWISFFGICLTIVFLFTLYSTRKQRKVEGYGVSIAQNCIFDLLFTITAIFLKIDITPHNGYFVYGITSIEYKISEIKTRILVSLIFGSCNLSILSTFVPFYIRYVIICKNKSVSMLKIILLYMSIISCIFVFLILLNSSATCSSPELENLQMKPYLLPKKEGRFWNFFGVKIFTIQVYILSFIMTLLVSINFSSILYFNYKVFQTLRINKYLETERKASLELQKTMTIQSIVQFFFMVTPITLMCLSCLMEFEGVIGVLFVLEMSPTVMTMSTFLSVSQYREKVKDFYYFVRDILIDLK